MTAAVETLREAARRIRADRAGDDTYDGRTLLAVADWLYEVAGSVEYLESVGEQIDPDSALSVARAYLGETS